MITPLIAIVEYSPHDGDVACSRCGASHMQNH